MWRSLVAHLTGGQGAVGSNPAIPTNQIQHSQGPQFFRGLLLVFLFAACLVGCSGPTNPSSVFAGRWEGTFTEAGGAVGRLSLNIQNSARGLAGDWNVQYPDPTMNDSGGVSGRPITAPDEVGLLLSSSKVCHFSGTGLAFVLNAKVAGDDMNGSMTGVCVPAIEGAVALRRR